MIVRTAQHQWIVYYADFEQHVVGTRKQAQDTEKFLRKLHKQTVDALPWYCRWIGKLNMWVIDLAHI